MNFCGGVFVTFAVTAVSTEQLGEALSAVGGCRRCRQAHQPCTGRLKHPETGFSLSALVYCRYMLRNAVLSVLQAPGVVASAQQHVWHSTGPLADCFALRLLITSLADTNHREMPIRCPLALGKELMC